MSVAQGLTAPEKLRDDSDVPEDRIAARAGCGYACRTGIVPAARRYRRQGPTRRDGLSGVAAILTRCSRTGWVAETLQC